MKQRKGKQVRLAYTKFSILLSGIMPEYVDFLETSTTDEKYWIAVRIVKKDFCTYNYQTGIIRFYDGSTYKPSKWTLTAPNGWKRAMTLNQAIREMIKRF